MLQKVKKNSHVTFIGVPGSGKTATAHHIALMLQQEGYGIVPIKDIRKIEDYCDPNNPQVFVIDDVVGVFGLQEVKMNLLLDYQDRIMKPTMPKSKTLMTCREAVFKKAIESNSFFKDKNTIVFLHSEAFALTIDDKKEILKNYHIEEQLMSPASLTSASKMFPYLCKLFSTEKKFQFHGYVFFHNPVPCILKELEELENQNKIHYVSLVLCMMNENELSEKILEERENEGNFNEIKLTVLRKCKVSRQTDNFKFVDAMSEMEGTYTKFCGTHYSFIHDSMFEIVAYHFGCKFPEVIVQFMSSSYIANYVRLHRFQTEKSEYKVIHPSENIGNSVECMLEGNEVCIYERIPEDKNVTFNVGPFDLCIKIRQDLYPMLAERLYRDIEKMELHDVFMNNVLKQPEVCEAFIEVLKTKSYTELKSLFLSVQKDVPKVVSKGERVTEESEKEDKWSREWKRQRVLTNTWREPEIVFGVRVISWVVYYGHSQILKCILEQIEVNKEPQSELFNGNCFNPNFRYMTGKGRLSRHIHEQYRLLLLSCYGGDLETVKVLLKYVKRHLMNEILRDFDDNYVWHDTPLTAACENGYMSIVKELLEAGAGVNLQGEDDTPLIAACKNGHLNIMKELLEAKAEVNLQGEGYTPMAAACARGHLNVVKELLCAGADFNAGDDYSTPLETACMNGHINIAIELLEGGADINLHRQKNTLFEVACAVGQTNLVKKLLEAGAYVNLQDTHNTSLIAACRVGHSTLVKEFLKGGADVNAHGNHNTPLTAACEGGHLSIVIKLLDAKADVNLQGYNKTPLIIASENGHLGVLMELLKAGADINAQCEEQSALTAACKSGHIEIVKKLMKEGANINLQCLGKTPLIAACKSGHLAVVKELLDTGANVNQGDDINSPLNAACEGGNLTVVKVLLEVGANVNSKDYTIAPLAVACRVGHLCVVRELFKADAEVNPKGHSNTPLTEACLYGHLSIVNELLKAKADVNLPDQFNTPLTAACRRGNLCIIKNLIKMGANVNLDENKSPLTEAFEYGRISVINNLLEDEANVIPQKQYETPLRAACANGHLCVVKELIEAGAKVNLQNHFTTPLTATCEDGHLNIVKELLKARAAINPRGHYYTPLTAACEGGHLFVTRTLLEAGANINLQDEFNTPLTAACRNRHFLVVKELLQWGANFNLSSKYFTPIIAACEGGHRRIVKELIDAGVCVNRKGESDSPLTTACHNGHMAVVNELLEAGAEVNRKGKDETPLTAACKGGYLRIIEKLIEEGADINPQGCHISPLAAACEKGHMRVVKELIDIGADINLISKCNTPLSSACIGGHMCVVKELLEAGADVNLESESDTPLTAACDGGHLNVVMEVLGAGADVNLQDKFKTPLTTACIKGNLAVVKELLKAGAVVNLQDIHDTPLTAACKDGHLDVVKELIEAGADVNKQDCFGNTPLHVIILHHTKLAVPAVLILNKYGADSTICNKESMSSLYVALIENKVDVVKQLLEIEREAQLNKLKLHFFNCLINIRHGGVISNSKDDVVIAQRHVWRIEEFGNLYDIIFKSECIVLKHLLEIGLDVNQLVQLYDDFNYESDVRPLLFFLIDEMVIVKDKVEKVKILLNAGVDVNIRVMHTMCNSELYVEEDDVLDWFSDEDGDEDHADVLDREGLSVLERTRRMVKKFSYNKYRYDESTASEYKIVLNEIKKHVRRYSV
ncbi:serine/threonine-protein phosphatase 6 regulatory ankyrin repeat subunit C-like [Saccostrea cucullata]|uniref:serine/threonine-protein phosphatase 6 regulatory ankyrin repeat subunit C-like n=1 Tax=Saccostrea cuccullata TaxID=36930 RepID=UPI002ECFD3DC